MEHNFLLDQALQNLKPGTGKLERRQFDLLSLRLLLDRTIDLFHLDDFAVYGRGSFIRVNPAGRGVGGRAAARGEKRSKYADCGCGRILNKFVLHCGSYSFQLIDLLHNLTIPDPI